jgi:2-polyprenyl-3-methyl-5-hydroxy-6-metoxy-1,4-benzoquinol methylase
MAVAREQAFPNTTVDAERAIRKIMMLSLRTGRLLDVGCGEGFFSKEAQDRGFTVDAIEIDPIQRSCAAHMLGKEPLDIPFEQFSGSDYDVLLLSQILEHVADVNEWASMSSRLLKPGGLLFVALPNFSSLIRKVLQGRDPYVTPPAHLNYFSPSNLVLLLEKHDFRVIEMETISRIPYTALSKRLPIAKSASELALKVGQKPLLRGVDRLGFGIFVNVYARAC